MRVCLCVWVCVYVGLCELGVCVCLCVFCMVVCACVGKYVCVWRNVKISRTVSPGFSDTTHKNVEIPRVETYKFVEKVPLMV